MKTKYHYILILQVALILSCNKQEIDLPQKKHLLTEIQTGDYTGFELTYDDQLRVTKSHDRWYDPIIQEYYYNNFNMLDSIYSYIITEGYTHHYIKFSYNIDRKLILKIKIREHYNFSDFIDTFRYEYTYNTTNLLGKKYTYHNNNLIEYDSLLYNSSNQVVKIFNYKSGKLYLVTENIYTNKNIIKIVLVDYVNENPNNIVVINIEYDDKKNPYKEINIYNTVDNYNDYSKISINNIIKENTVDRPQVTTMTYKYNKYGYPTECYTEATYTDTYTQKYTRKFIYMMID